MLNARDKGKGYLFPPPLSLLANPFRSIRCPRRAAPRRAPSDVLGHRFARNIIRKHRKQMSEPSNWNERRLNESKDRKYTLKRKRGRKWDDGRGREGVGEEGRVWQWVVGGLVSSRGLAFIKSTKAPRGMVFRCEYYICYRKLSVVLVLPPTFPPQTTISRSLFLSCAPSPCPSSVARFSLLKPSLLLRYTLRFVLAGDYDTDKGKIRPREKNPSGSQNQKCRGAPNELLRI